MPVRAPETVRAAPSALPPRGCERSGSCREGHRRYTGSKSGCACWWPAGARPRGDVIRRSARRMEQAQPAGWGVSAGRSETELLDRIPHCLEARCIAASMVHLGNRTRRMRRTVPQMMLVEAKEF